MTLKPFLDQELKRRGISIDVGPINIGHRSKYDRIIDGFQPFVTRGQVYFQKDQKKLIDEMLHLRISNREIKGDSPNRVDALANQAQFWHLRVVDTDEIEEIEYIDPFLAASNVPAYGLECVT
jgi:hypothetical protein